MDSGTVFIVDDEEAVRDSIAMLLRSVGLRTQLFADATSFLRQYRGELAGCLVLDVRMPRMSGLELQQELNRRGWTLPVIFITGHGDVPMAVEAMRAGALDFLQKPFKDDDLIRRVQKALDQQRRGTKMIMQVHDELVFEVPEGEVDWLKSEIPQLMAGVAALKVPLLAEVGVGPNWDKAH